MSAKTVTLDDGTEISQDNFGRLIGGGMKKAAKQQRKLKIDGQDFFFTIADMSVLQQVIDQLVTENKELRALVSGGSKVVSIQTKGRRGRSRKQSPSDAAALATPPFSKPRFRVQAGSSRFAA